MMPATQVPEGSDIRTPVDIKLAPKWRYDAAHRIFVSDAGEEFDPGKSLPKETKIVYKVPSLASAPEDKLSKSEKNLRRYMQIILPASESPSKYVEEISSWVSVEEAHVAPEVSLPGFSN